MQFILASSCLSLCLLLSLQNPIAKAQPPPHYIVSACNNTYNYTQGSQYEANLRLNFNSLASNVTPNGLSMATSGIKPDKVYGLLRCRADVSIQDCQICGKNSALEIVQRCRDQKEAVLFYDDCMLRYAGYRFFSIPSSDPLRIVRNTQIASNPNVFNKQLKALMDDISAKAASDPRKYSTGSNSYYSSEYDVYGMVQCNGDLSENSCLTCLQGLSRYIYDGNIGAQVYSSTCLIIYDIHPFGGASLWPTPPSPPATSTNKTTTRDGNIVY